MANRVRRDDEFPPERLRDVMLSRVANRAFERFITEVMIPIAEVHGQTIKPPCMDESPLDARACCREVGHDGPHESASSQWSDDTPSGGAQSDEVALLERMWASPAKEV